MAGKYNFELLHKYPHLLGEDVPIWQKFIQRFPGFFDSVDYDVKIGSGVNSDIINDKKYRTYYQDLTKKRIDVIGWKNDLTFIVEIKKRVSFGTLGQILGYRYFYLKEHPELHNLNVMVICSSIDQDEASLFDNFFIRFIVIV
ncbi:hypothetical protein ES705_23375 [subsurface metagenome]